MGDESPRGLNTTVKQLFIHLFMHATIPYKDIPSIHTLPPHHIFGRRDKPKLNKVYSLIIADPVHTQKDQREQRPPYRLQRLRLFCSTKQQRKIPTLVFHKKVVPSWLKENLKTQRKKIPSQTLSASLITLWQRWRSRSRHRYSPR